MHSWYVDVVSHRSPPPRATLDLSFSPTVPSFTPRILQNIQLEQNLDRLRYAAMDLLTKLARQFRHKRNGIIFLINNYTHLVQVTPPPSPLPFPPPPLLARRGGRWLNWLGLSSLSDTPTIAAPPLCTVHTSY